MLSRRIENAPFLLGFGCDNLFYRTQKGSVFNGFRLSKRRFSVVPVAAGEERPLSKIELQRLAEVPPEAEWFGNLTNENTKRAYRHDVTSFMRFVGIKRPEDFRTVARAHVIAMRAAAFRITRRTTRSSRTFTNVAN